MKEYTITVNGVDLTVQLDDADAERLGAKETGAKAPAPANKSRVSGK